MAKYENLSGESNVDSYQIGEDSITIQFMSGKVRNYLYNYSAPGKIHVDKMKALAKNGRGLNGYISSVVRSNFAKKW